MDQKNLFILAGNGPYDNRGCEAIVRGTTEIIRQHFDAPEFISISHFQSNNQFKAQAQNEYDHSITHHQTCRAQRRFSPYWFLHRALRFSIPSLWGRLTYRAMLPALKEAQAVLSVGGDNYSLDYDRPVRFTVLDDLVLAYKKPLIIWGASVGPFDRMPDYARYMIKHLKKVTGIFVRETLSLEYLASKGVRDNVFLVADPAFLLKPVEPTAAPKIEDDAIGINLSPLMARYLTDGDLQKLVILTAQIVREVQNVTGRKIYLIPHVTSPHSNDYVFLKNVLTLLNGIDVMLIDDRYSAAEIKWIISKMALFAGVRTHSTIAAFSSGVPTISFVYSIKAVGINKDLFGHDRYCIYRKDCHPAVVAEKMGQAIKEFSEKRQEFLNSVARMRDFASRAGQKLKELIL